MAEDDETPKPPAPGAQPPSAPAEPIYIALWNSYRDGVRNKTELRRLHRLRWKTVDHAIEHGWPEHGFASLKSRAELWDRQKQAAVSHELAVADRQAASRSAKDQVAPWVRFQPKAVALLFESQAVLETLAGKIKSAMDGATFVRYRRVRTVDPQTGRVVVVDKAYVDATEVAQAARTWAAAYKDTAMLMSLVTGRVGARTDAPAPEFTAEQLAMLQAGQLPEGVTVEMVAQAVLAGSGGEGQ